MPTMRTEYHVAEGSVSLSITVGDAQMGASAVWLEGKKILQGDDIRNARIGDGRELRGKELVIKTVVTDVNDKTNHISVTYDLAGGVKEAELFLESTVQENGESVLYRTSIAFV